MREAAGAARSSPPLRVGRIAALGDPATLSGMLGPIDRIDVEPMRTSGFSGSTHARVIARLPSGDTIPLVLKRTPLAGDWMARRTGDRVGREAALLAEPGLEPMWRAFDCPYVAYAIEDGAIGLLMHDVSAHLLPDRREPMSAEHEERLLGALAAMHARFWGSPAIAQQPWLAPAAGLIGLLAPAAVAALPAEERAHPVIARALAGWEVAFRHLPAAQASVLRQPVEALAARGRDLPHTLIHGDCKVANFAFLPDGRVAAFDWALAARAPVTLELGWYLAVNASRVSAGKPEAFARYRAALDRALDAPLGDDAWRRIEVESALAGAAMLLWSKALAFEEGTPQSRAEWEWYLERLPRA